MFDEIVVFKDDNLHFIAFTFFVEIVFFDTAYLLVTLFLSTMTFGRPIFGGSLLSFLLSSVGTRSRFWFLFKYMNRYRYLTALS